MRGKLKFNVILSEANRSEVEICVVEGSLVI